MIRAVIVFALVLLLGACGGSLASETPKRIGVIGDSITAGYMPYGGVTLQLRQDQAYTRELEQAGEVITAAVGGATTAMALNNQAEWLRGTHLDVLVVHLGTNDAYQGLDRAQALRNVSALLDRWPNAKQVIVAPMRWAGPQEAWLAPWVEDLRELSRSRGAAFVDLRAAEAPEWRCHPIDRHPCASAHREIGRLILAAITAT